MKEKTMEEKIKFLKNWISKHGTTGDLERLLHGMERENLIRVNLIPKEIFHELTGSNLSPIPMEDVPKYQRAYTEFDWNALAIRGAAVKKAKTLVELDNVLKSTE